MRRRRGIRLALAGLLLVALGALTASMLQAQTIAVNFLRFTPAATGSPPEIAAFGVDTNIGIKFTPKGSGSISGVGQLEISTTTQSSATTTSYQAVAGDFNVGAAWGSSTAASPTYGAGLMGNIIGTGGGSATKNLLAGVIAKFDWTGTHLSTYPKGAFIAEIGDTVTGSAATGGFAAVMAVMGGDSGQATTKAMFQVDWLNSTPTTRAEGGIDLQGPGAHDSYLTPRYSRGWARFGNRNETTGATTTQDICILGNNAAPVDGTSGDGAGNCDAGSIFIRQDGASSNIYVNRGSKASPTWTAAI